MRNLKKWMSLGLAAAMAFSVTACGGSGSEAKTEAAKETEAAKAEEGKTEAAGEVDKSEQLVIYTNSGSNGRGEWLKELAKTEGYNIEVVQIQGGDLANRIITEKNNPQADMVFGLNAMEYEKLKAEEVLDPWEPTWKADVDMSLGDPDGYYYPIVI